MEPNAGILTVDAMSQYYGSFFAKSRKVEIDAERVPRQLWPLLPYAEFWGVADDWAREDLVRQAPSEVKSNLKAAVTAFDDALDDWLAGEEADSPCPSPQYIAFSAMRMAADFV